MSRLRRNGALAGTLALLGTGVLAQPSVYETEPNNQPGVADPISGEVIVVGTMVKSDQDGFLWTVSDVDAQKRWTFELQGIPGKLTVAEIVRIEFADNGVDVTDYDKLMKMGSRDGLTPAVQRDLVFEPGEYLIGLAYAGGGSKRGGNGGGMFRPPAASLSFGGDGTPNVEEGADAPAAAEPGGYRFIIREGSRLPVNEYPGPRPDRKSAKSMRLGREFATYETEAVSWFAFEFASDEATERWDIRAQAPVGRRLKARLVDAEGEELAAVSADDRGRLAFRDLAPGAETLYVELRAPEPGFVQAIESELVGQRVEGEEAEPNDDWKLANRIDLARPVTGRISEGKDSDYFRFSLDEETTDHLLTLRFEATNFEDSIRFCLRGADGSGMQCRDAKTPIELPDLALTPGEWGLSVSRAKEGLEYAITMSESGAIEAGREAEPNDAIEHASGVPANNRIKGRLTDDDDDFYQFTIADEPQLWRFQVIGEGIREVAYYDGSGNQKARVRPRRNQRRIRFENLFLLPGRHFVRVSGGEGDYTLLARALGPPDPDGEREPNDGASRAQRLAIGQTRTGLLPDEDDEDTYRFFLAHWDHVRLTIEPPPDGTVRTSLVWYDKGLGQSSGSDPGEPVSISGLFPPGDYRVTLESGQPSDAEYRLSLERLPRFSCSADCEPNGMGYLWLATPLPPDHVVEGTAGEWGDTDVYELPLLAAPSELVVRTNDKVYALLVGKKWDETERLEWDDEAGIYRGTVPAGGPYRFYVRTKGADYRLALEFADGPTARVEPQPAAELEVELGADAVSAYRTHGQRVTGEVRLRNSGGGPLDAVLEAVTSDYRWRVRLDRTAVEVPAGGRVHVPITIDVPPDAWAERPVRISVAARPEDGGLVETWQEIGVGRDAAPVEPTWGWRIPDALRGGFNAAWSGLGGRLAGDYPTSLGSRFEQIHDGMTVAGNGMDFRGRDGIEERSVTIELPGEEPVPVAGVALNHFGAGGPYNSIRRATLLLSTDGTEFEEVLELETQPVRTEQHFPLEESIPARFARLRIDATFSEELDGRGDLGEWKVITDPGFDLSGGRGFNLGDRDLGGHVVWADPRIAVHWDYSILTEKKENPSVRLFADQDLEWVVGFHHDRTAQIVRLEWVEAAKATGESRFERVTVSASPDSPVGPWRPVAEWTLGAGEVKTLELDQPIWARFLKFTAQGPDSRQWRYPPETLRIWERPTGDSYTSILTEWGHGRREAYYELEQGLPSDPASKAAGNSSRERAARLAPGTTVAGEVALGEYDRWYRLDVPSGENTLTVSLSGDPTVRTVVSLEDGNGGAVPLKEKAIRSTTSRHVFEAVVEPGATYFLRVEEPPRNVVFSWDTSASVNAYLATIYNSLSAFASQVVPGQEAVNMVPFGRGPLLGDWYGEPYVLQTILNDYPRRESSSEAEQTLEKAARVLAPRAGTKAIMLITDAATNRHAKMWGEMKRVKPRIFSVGVAGTGKADEEQDRFQDWSSVNGGYYRHLVYDGEMEVAFDRAATMLRRPAEFTLGVETEFREAPGPGTLVVVAGENRAAAAGGAVELILDASGSMLQRLEGKRRIAIAKEVLTEAVESHIPAGTLVALRVFGHREPNACRTDLEIPMAPLDPAAAVEKIAAIEAKNLAKTPIADSLAEVASDLKDASGQKVVVLVTDGEETCDGDPEAVIESLTDKGFDLHLNIVGFAIDDDELASQFESWAELGGGRYLSAVDQAGLSDALAEALKTPFSVYDRSGSVVAQGVVGGEPVELEAGFYRVVVATSPPRTYEKVEVPGESEVRIELAAAGD